MISDKSIRTERFEATMILLDEILDNIPLSKDARERIESIMYDIKILFREAN